MLNRKVVFCTGDGRGDNHPCKAGSGQAPVLQIVYDNWKNYQPATPNIFTPASNGQYYLGCNKSSSGFDSSSFTNPTNTQITKQDGNCNQDRMPFGIGINNINDGNNGDRDEPYITLDVANLQNGNFWNQNNRQRVNNNQDHNTNFSVYSGVYGMRSFTGDRYGVNSGSAGGSDRLDNRMAIIDKSAPVQVTPQVVTPSNTSSVDYVNSVINDPPSPLYQGGVNPVNINKDENGVTYLGRSPLDPNNTNLQVSARAPQYSDDLLGRVRIRNKENTAVIDISNGNLNSGTSINMWGNNPWLRSTSFLMDGNRFRTSDVSGGGNNTAYCLDASAGTTTNTPIHLWECHQGYNQDWVYDTVTSQIKMLSRQDLCWEQARPYDNSSPVGISLQACDTNSTVKNGVALVAATTGIKPTQQFNIESLEEIRMKLRDTDRSIQHNGNNGDNGSTIKMSYDGLDWQKFYYSTLTGEIRNHNNNYCLTAPASPNLQVVILSCSNPTTSTVTSSGYTPKVNPDQRWEFTNGTVKSLLPNTNFCLGVSGNKWQVDIQVLVLNCNPADGNQQIYKESVFKRYFGTLGMQTQSALVRLTTTNTDPLTGQKTQVPTNPNEAVNSTLLPLQTSPNIQYANNPSSTNPKEKLLNQEDVFGITTKGLDRITGDGNAVNQSYYSNIAKFRLDIDLPVVSGLAITQVGSSLQATATVTDKNLALVQVELIQNINGIRTTVAKESNCRLRNGDTVPPATQSGVNPCNITKTPFTSTIDNKLVFNVNLTDSIPSGQYEVQVRAYDRAGNISADSATNNLVEIDKDPAKIAISWPINNSWVNTPTTAIQGAVAGYNYDASGNSSLERNRDVASLTIKEVTPKATNSDTAAPATQVPTAIPIDENKNWSTTVNLKPGNNQYELETTDKSGNKNNWIGDTSSIASSTTNNRQGKQAKWNINLDTTLPVVNSTTMTIKSVLADGTNGDTVVAATSNGSSPTISSSDPSFSFNILDTESGMNTGLNPKGYYITLIKDEVETSTVNNQTTTKSVGREIPLYFNDTVVSDPNPSPRLTSNLDCTKTAITSTVNCKIKLANLANGSYSLAISVQDRASNKSTQIKTNWTVNSFQQGIVNLDILPRTETQANLLVTPIDKATTTKGYTIVNAVSTPYSKNLVCINSPELRAQNLASTASQLLAKTTTRPIYTAPTTITPNPINCDMTVETTANMIGQIATGIVLPIANISYQVSVVRLINNGVALVAGTILGTTQSNISTISYSTPAGFSGLEVTTSLDGLNTADEVKSVLNGTTSISKLKKTQIKVVVPRGTEALDVDYGDLTNLNISPNGVMTTTDQSINGITGTNGGGYGSTSNGMVNFNYNRITTVNDAPENSTILNPTRDASIKKNQYGQTTTATLQTANSPAIPAITIKNGNDLSRKELFNPCNQETCTWTVNYYLPYYQSGGSFDIRVRMYKGESIQEASRSISINGVIPTSPTLLRADKGVLTNQCRHERYGAAMTASPTTGNNGVALVAATKNWTANLTLSEASNCIEYNVIGNSSIVAGTVLTPTPTIYTNSDRNKLILGADKDTSILIQVTKPDKAIEYLARRTNNAGILYLDYYTTLDGNYLFSVIKNNNGIYVPLFNLTRDTIVPALTATTTTNLSNPDSTNPWAKTGDNIQFSLTTNEPVATGAVIGENGFRSPIIKNMTKGNNGLAGVAATGTNCSSFTPIDLLAGTLVGGLTNNTNTPAVPASCHNDYLLALSSTTSLTINRSEEGIYTPIILLTDIAGNSSLITSGNNTPNPTSPTTQATPQAQITAQKAIAGSSIQRTSNNATFWDYNDLFYASSQVLDTSINPIKDTLPVNYPYTQQARTNSLDFRLFLDNTAPAALDWDIKPYQDNKDGVQADGLNPERDRIATDIYTTRNNTNLYPRIEKNLRLRLDITSTNNKANQSIKSSLDSGILARQQNTSSNNGDTPLAATVNYTNCIPTRAANKIGKDGFITQDQQDCTLPIIIDNTKTSLINTGSITPSGLSLTTPLDTTNPFYGHSDNGTPSTRTSLSYTTIDLAGNRAIYASNSTASSVLTVAYDKDRPLTEVEANQRNIAESRSNTSPTGVVGGSSILEVKADNSTLTSNIPTSDYITNKTIIDTKTTGEAKLTLQPI